jgi:hypothetical protein
MEAHCLSFCKPNTRAVKSPLLVRKYLETPDIYGMLIAVLSYKRIKALTDSNRKQKQVDGILEGLVSDIQKAVTKAITRFTDSKLK